MITSFRSLSFYNVWENQGSRWQPTKAYEQCDRWKLFKHNSNTAISKCLESLKNDCRILPQGSSSSKHASGKWTFELGNKLIKAVDNPHDHYLLDYNNLLSPSFSHTNHTTITCACQLLPTNFHRIITSRQHHHCILNLHILVCLNLFHRTLVDYTTINHLHNYIHPGTTSLQVTTYAIFFTTSTKLLPSLCPCHLHFHLDLIFICLPSQ